MKDENNLENQITLMLDQVLDDEGNNGIAANEETSNLIFSDNEDDSTISFKEYGYAHVLNSPSVQSVEMNKQHQSFNKYQRIEKKFGTISFNNNNIPLFSQSQIQPKPYINIAKANYFNSPLGCHLPMPMYPVNCPPLNALNPLMFSSQMNVTQGMQPTHQQLQQQGQHQQMMANGIRGSLSPRHTNGFNTQNKFERTNIRKNTYAHNKDLYPSNLASASSFAPNKIRNNCNVIHEERRFGTMVFPQGTDMKIEMLLYELNNNYSKVEKIDHHLYNKLQGNFAAIIRTHKGSKTIQNLLKNTHSEIIHQILVEINPLMSELMKDSYANFFCKQFFTFLNQKDRIDLLISIKDSIVQLAVDSIGTYPIQGIIEQVGSKIEKKIIITALQGSLGKICLDTYGTHVVEKIICCFEEEFISFIYDYVYNNFLSLANHINGICVVKKILSLTHKKDLHDKIKAIIQSNQTAFALIQHSYGNYVIQVIVECWDDSEIKEILSQFESKYTMLSMQKYSSNVVERCIEKSIDILNEYIDEVCSSGLIAEVMKNNFGNYVIQNALKLASGKSKSKIVEAVVNNINKLNDKKIIAKWKLIVSPHVDSNTNNANNHSSSSLNSLMVNSESSSPVKVNAKGDEDY